MVYARIRVTLKKAAWFKKNLIERSSRLRTHVKMFFPQTDCSTPEELRKKLVSTLITLLSSGADEECPVCLDSLCTPVITHCAHVFCRRCIEDVIKTSELNPRCPLCRGCIGMDVLVEVPPEAEECIDETDGEGEWHSSSKV